MSLTQALGQAYARSQVDRDQAGAVAQLRSVIADPEAEAEARTKRDELAAVIARRTRQACHITAVTYDLLDEALKEHA